MNYNYFMWLWLFIVLFLVMAVFFEHKAHRQRQKPIAVRSKGLRFWHWIKRDPPKQPMDSPTKVRWLLPNDRYAESNIAGIANFIQLLNQVNGVACHSLSYKVAHVELIVEEELWIAVSLE